MLILSTASIESSATIAVLDITNKNYQVETSGDYSRSVYSATYLCDIAGYDYFVTEDLEEAMGADMILLANVITNTSFTKEEAGALKEWIKDGGVLLSSAIKSVPNSCKDTLSEIFGIDATKEFTKSTERPLINWNPEYYDNKELEYIDDANERATSIGNVKCFTFTPDGCEVLAYFSDNTAAVARHRYGKGAAYLAGVTWRDVVQRNQLNKDQKASREYSNGFEPSSDVWALFIRSIHSMQKEIGVWKFTVPAGYTQVLIPTHDCDSKTAYDSMYHMSDYEKSLGLSGHYFLTTHYFSDKVNFGYSYLSDFYNSTTIPKAKALLTNGHTVGSHSICHFPDFNKTRNTDIVTRDEYAHRATCVDGTSTGASTWAEIVMSKQIIEGDLGNHVRSFRSGHLCVNPDFHAMLETGDYDFQSCYTGGDLLSQFPFIGRYDNDWEKDQSRVLTIPLHISDVYGSNDGFPLNDDTWETHPCPDHWESAMDKMRGNYASTVLLIHPNRDWKMKLQKKLIDRLNRSDVGLYNFEDYGDFWLSRLKNEYTYDYDKEKGELTIVSDLDDLKKSKMTYGVELNGIEMPSVVISNEEGTAAYRAKMKKLTDNRYLAIPDFESGAITVGVDEIQDNKEFGSALGNTIVNLNGTVVYSGKSVEDMTVDLPKGIYILKEGTKAIKIKI